MGVVLGQRGRRRGCRGKSGSSSRKQQQRQRQRQQRRPQRLGPSRARQGHVVEKMWRGAWDGWSAGSRLVAACRLPPRLSAGPRALVWTCSVQHDRAASILYCTTPRCVQTTTNKQTETPCQSRSRCRFSSISTARGVISADLVASPRTLIGAMLSPPALVHPLLLSARKKCYRARTDAHSSAACSRPRPSTSRFASKSLALLAEEADG
jgi:hypothetical protein